MQSGESGALATRDRSPFTDHCSPPPRTRSKSMHRTLACLLALALGTTAGAHFVFIVPDKDGSAARVVFSDDLSPDENVPVSKIAGTKLTLRAGDGKPAAL